MKSEISYWMTKHPLKIDVHESLSTAAEIMGQEAISHLLVYDQGFFVGVISERDLDLSKRVAKRASGKERSSEVTVGDVASFHPVTVDARADMLSALKLMKEKNIHSLIVINERKSVTGILTSSDVLLYTIVAAQNIESTYHKA